ncbi:hypothetical protein A33M_1702 [Rhodovulum sp. PH10]|nr:hypothetical protein [Rhodovulum sp. PH10]EJW12732.1 hypothetical protein A33M_1702 [Rhodovulum sp. PH10]
MSLWQLAACVDGWNKTHSASAKPEPPSEEEFDAMKRAHGDA